MELLPIAKKTINVVVDDVSNITIKFNRKKHQ